MTHCYHDAVGDKFYFEDSKIKLTYSFDRSKHDGWEIIKENSMVVREDFLYYIAIVIIILY